MIEDKILYYEIICIEDANIQTSVTKINRLFGRKLKYTAHHFHGTEY